MRRILAEAKANAEMDVDTASTLIGSKRASPFLPDDLELAGSAVQPIRIAYGYPKQPLQAFADLPGGQHVSAQYTSGVFPWSSSFQHGGLVDGKVWAAGIQWPEPTPTKDSAMQKIHAALADAGVPADAFDSSQTYVSTKYGVANSKLAGDSFSLTFTDPAAAMELLLGKISVSLPIRGATSADAGLSGSPVWTKHPGTLQLAKGDYAAAKVLVLSKSIEGLDAGSLRLGVERRKERKLGKWAGLSLRLGVERRKERKLGKWAELSLRLGVERRKERKLGKWDGLSLRLGVERRKERKPGKWAGLSLRLGVERRKERKLGKWAGLSLRLRVERRKERKLGKWAGLSLSLGVERWKERKLGKWAGLSLRLGVERRKERKLGKWDGLSLRLGVERREERKPGKWAGLSLRLGVERRKERKLGKWAGLSLRLGVERRKERKLGKWPGLSLSLGVERWKERKLGKWAGLSLSLGVERRKERKLGKWDAGVVSQLEDFHVALGKEKENKPLPCHFVGDVPAPDGTDVGLYWEQHPDTAHLRGASCFSGGGWNVPY